MLLNFPGDNGIPVSSENYPLKSSRHGQGLKLQLVKNKMKVKPCTAMTMMIHSPYEPPGNFELIDMVEFDFAYDFDVLITPEIIRTDADLKSLDPEDRGCYFEGERNLTFFEVYTRRNCEAECYIYSIYDFVNCVPYFMAQPDTVDYCDYHKEYRMRAYSYNINAGMNKNQIKCRCLDECDVIKYKYEIHAHNRRKWNETIEDEDKDAYTQTTIEFKFKDIDVVPLRRYLSFTFTEFLAQAGGMLGLFAGISALSLIEIAYFLTFRWLMNITRWICKKFM
jgi:acid-sensing ion channel, other